jgi:hypothetical protein
MDETPALPNKPLPPVFSGGESSPPGKKGWKKFWIVLGLIVLAVLAFNPISLMIFGVLIGSLEIKRTEKKLQQPAVYEPTARALATYCQSDQSLFPSILSYAWLPQGVARLGHPWCEISTNFAFVEMGGGFYHFGYKLVLNQAASVPGTNAWELFLAREGSKDLPLTTLRLAAAQHVTGDDLEKIVGGTFDQSIKEGKGGYQGKVRVQLRFGQIAKATATCEDWIKAKPNSWCARFTYAHLRCRRGETEPAAAEFSGWVNAHPDFANYIYLALFNLREGRTNQAVEAVRPALGQSLAESPDAGANNFFLGLNGVMIAYAGGDYDLCQSLCDKLLADKNSGWRREVLRVKAAATFMKAQQTTAIDLMTQAENANEPDPFSHEPRAKADRLLMDAIQNKDAESVRDFAKWADSMERWYSPFETDESEFHGPHLGVPTPYPASWKTDSMNGDVDQ